MTYVVATAGHVDHGKSTLVRALTGMEPDRLAEEHRRGLSIQLGFVWTTWPETGEVAFVDVPGHRRFLRTTLAGLGPTAFVLLVVAADEGWMPQSAEHLAVLDALGVERGVLVITKIDRAAPERAARAARTALHGTSLATVPSVAVSARTGAGMSELVRVLATGLAGLPQPDVDRPSRLWVDRVFTVTGAGPVVTGTLMSGVIETGAELHTADGRRVRVHGLEALGTAVDRVVGPARVAVRLRGRDGLARGDALVAPGTHVSATELDVRLVAPAPWLQTGAALHLGSASVTCRVRPLGVAHARLQLAAPLPLLVGDRAVLRDPGRPGALVGVRVLDLAPPPLAGRGAAVRRSAELAGTPDEDAAGLVLARGPVTEAELAARGLPPECGIAVAPGWRVGADRWADLAARLRAVLDGWRARDPLARPPTAALVAQRLGLPTSALVGPLAEAAGVDLAGAALPDEVQVAVERLLDELRQTPFAAPSADRLSALGLDDAALSAAARAGALLRLAPRVVLRPGADEDAVVVLADLGQPFRVTDAATALGTTRRTVVPLLEHLDRLGRTRPVAGGLRTVGRARPGDQPIEEPG